jgi:hypothetical protein
MKSFRYITSVFVISSVFAVLVKALQFGLAANFDEFGPSPAVEMNTGLFIRKEIF